MTERKLRQAKLASGVECRMFLGRLQVFANNRWMDVVTIAVEDIPVYQKLLESPYEPTVSEATTEELFDELRGRKESVLARFAESDLLSELEKHGWYLQYCYRLNGTDTLYPYPFSFGYHATEPVLRKKETAK